MHGVPKLYSSLSSEEELKDLIDNVKKDRETKSAFVYFNNDNNAFAVRNAEKMKELIKYDNNK